MMISEIHSGERSNEYIFYTSINDKFHGLLEEY